MACVSPPMGEKIAPRDEGRLDSVELERLGETAEARQISDDPLAFLLRLCEIYGLDFAVYATILSDGRVVGYTNYPEEWVEIYTRESLHEIDPVIRAAASSIVPVDWRTLGGDYAESEVFRRAREYGISPCGLSVPVRGPYGDFAVFSVTKDCGTPEWKALCKAIIRDMQFVAFYFHDAIMRQHGMSKLLSKKTLSRREREVLQWYAHGKTQSDIAVLTGLSVSTVSAYLLSSRTKLNALTTAHAAARAIRLGEIHSD